MPLNIKVCHLRYCRIVGQSPSLTVALGGESYRLSLQHADFLAGKGIVVESLDGQMPSSDFLLWLSVYVGEDFLDPFSELDTRFVSQRGDFPLDQDRLQRFLDVAERMRRENGRPGSVSCLKMRFSIF